MVYGKKTLAVAAAVLALGFAAGDASAAAGGGKSKKDTSDVIVKLTRPFVIPVNERSLTTSVVVLRVNIQMVGKDTAEAQESESLIRDRILTALIALSHEGHFAGGITDPAVSVLIKDTVRSAVEQVYPEGVGDVLIQDLLRKRIV